MASISAQSWRLKFYDRHERYVSFNLVSRSANDTEYRLFWWPNTNLVIDDCIVGYRVVWGNGVSRHVQIPKKMALAMAMLCGPVPYGRVYGKDRIGNDYQ